MEKTRNGKTGEKRNGDNMGKTKPTQSRGSALDRVKLKYEERKGTGKKLDLSPGFNPKYPGGDRTSAWVRNFNRPFLFLRAKFNQLISFLNREFREW